MSAEADHSIVISHGCGPSLGEGGVPLVEERALFLGVSQPKDGSTLDASKYEVVEPHNVGRFAPPTLRLKLQ